jgi:hypothetical protein
MTTPSPSTKIGFVQPNSRILAATWATCSSECVRELRAWGRSARTDRSSIWGGQPGVTTCVSRSNYANCAIFLPCGPHLQKQVPESWRRPVAAGDAPFAPVASTRPVSRRPAPGWPRAHLPARAHAAATERATCPSDVASANLPPGFIEAMQSATTWRKRRACSPLRRRRPVHRPCDASSSGCPCRGSGGSCTSYHSAGVSQRDCRRLLEQPDCLQVTFPAKAGFR